MTEQSPRERHPVVNLRTSALDPLRSKLRSALLLSLLAAPAAVGSCRDSRHDVYPPCSMTAQWCDDAEVAERYAKGTEKENDCPKLVRGSPAVEEPDAGDTGADAAPRSRPPEYTDARLSPRLTAERRDGGAPSACCYEYNQGCPGGRPLLDERGGARVAEARLRSDWADFTSAPTEPGPPLDARLRGTLADAWLEDALAEHASVASFARATLELLAVGAPPDLVAGCQRAGLDEVWHAAQCFALASRYAGAPLGPGPLAPVAPREADLARLARDTFLEGCVGETIAALVAARALTRCEDPAVGAVLGRIAEDEAEHAALAWSTLGWALRTGGPAVAEVVREAARAAAPRTGGSKRSSGRRAVASGRRISKHGRLDRTELGRARRDAWTELVEPLLAEALATAPRREDAFNDAPPSPARV